MEKWFQIFYENFKNSFQILKCTYEIVSKIAWSMHSKFESIRHGFLGIRIKLSWFNCVCTCSNEETHCNYISECGLS